MRYWVQYMQRSVYPPGSTELIDGCGDRSVFILDGRNSEETMHADAKKFAQRMQHIKQWEAYRICKGARLFEEARASRVVRLTYPIHV